MARVTWSVTRRPASDLGANSFHQNDKFGSPPGWLAVLKPKRFVPSNLYIQRRTMNIALVYIKGPSETSPDDNFSNNDLLAKLTSGLEGASHCVTWGQHHDMKRANNQNGFEFDDRYVKMVLVVIDDRDRDEAQMSVMSSFHFTTINAISASGFISFRCRSTAGPVRCVFAQYGLQNRIRVPSSWTNNYPIVTQCQSPAADMGSKARVEDTRCVLPRCHRRTQK